MFEQYAAHQSGVVIASQFAKHDVSRAALRHAVDSGRLVELVSGAFALAGADARVEQRAHAALLLAGDGSALSHRTAAALFGFAGFAKDPIHVSLPGRRRLTLPEGYLVHRPTRSFDTNCIGKLRVTTMPRTVLDCAGELRGFPLEVMLDDAHLRFADVGERLQRELAQLKRLSDVPGGWELKRLLDARMGQASESHEELRFWRLLRRSNLPPFQLQVEIRDEAGRYVMTVDFAWIAQRVVVHFDSYFWHWRRTTFDDDAAKRGRLAALGWHNFIVTKATLDSEQCIEDLRAVLAQRDPQRRFGF